MKICFLWIGKTKNLLWKGLIDEYLQRISEFVSCSRIELKEDKAKNIDPSLMQVREGRTLIQSINRQKGFNVLIDQRGKELTSREVAEFLSRRLNDGTKQINFVVGGYNGLSDEIRKQADMLFSLSKLTFTHEMARVILLEQIYRAFAIIGSLPYHK